jgi:sugar phosphate isomerase/epimerase
MRVTLQLYTVRDPLSQDLVGTLRAIRDIGFEYVELAGDYGKSAAEWSDMLGELGLRVSGSHIGLDTLQSNLDGVIADAKTIGMPWIVLPWLGADQRADYAALGETLESIAQRLNAEGLGFAYHNHDFEFTKNEQGEYGLDELFAAAPSLQSELDLAWVKIGGADPADYLEKYRGRMAVVHGKDFDPARTPRWVPAGQGILGYDDLLPACLASGAEFIAVELDESPGDPLEASKASFEFYRSQGLS